MVNDLGEVGVVKVPGDDGREDLLGDLLNNVETWKENSAILQSLK